MPKLKCFSAKKKKFIVLKGYIYILYFMNLILKQLVTWNYDDAKYFSI